MKRWWLVAALVGSIGTAQAQAPEAVASFLEHRVPEELALEGVLLSRHNVTLHIEQVGDILILSLVDNSTTRVVASTKLDAVPADREAAVATTTHLVADLVTQISAAAPAPPPAPTPAPAPPPLSPPIRKRTRSPSSGSSASRSGSATTTISPSRITEARSNASGSRFKATSMNG